jgi:hypothetical protein
VRRVHDGHAAAGVGLVLAITWAHYIGLVGALLMAGVVLSTQRVRPNRLPSVLVVLGLVPLLWHIALHLAGGANHPSTTFNLTNQLAIALLTTAVLANVWYARGRATTS